MEDSELGIKNIEDKVATNTRNIAINAADIATYHPGTIVCILVYHRNHYFGLGPIPKQKPKLANTFGQYRNQNHISKEKSSYQ